MLKEGYTPSPDEQSIIDEQMTPRKEALSAWREEEYNRLSDEDKELVHQCSLTFDTDNNSFAGEIKGHKVEIYDLGNDWWDGYFDGMKISRIKAEEIAKKYIKFAKLFPQEFEAAEDGEVRTGKFSERTKRSISYDIELMDKEAAITDAAVNGIL